MAEQADKLRVAQLQRAKRRGRLGLKRGVVRESSATGALEGRAISLPDVR